MDNRTNTIAGWILAACVAALGLSIASGMIFHEEKPEKMGYPVKSAEPEGGGAAAPEVPFATLLASADPDKGKQVFNKCAACHTINQGGPNGIGPNLYATVGDPIGHGKRGFAFSDALKNKGGNWTFDQLNEWLTSPRKFAPGTKMTFAGLPKAQDRADVIAYLNAQGSNLPLPKAPEKAIAGADNADAPANDSGPLPTAGIQNRATLAPGAPSNDPQAAVQAAKHPGD
ncbi:hypothetical protein GCM10023219_14160 [Stakelama sediminis]|uniref:Cytochrome c n=1 Tax=Stakelama sediminis TaxID=463200 RepID=A0A840YWP2_9SPHN|nr:cytochrome c family protein [Stakelama sediminis]MBB5718141.1 cytochrome c [Stakelama sediminis]